MALVKEKERPAPATAEPAENEAEEIRRLAEEGRRRRQRFEERIGPFLMPALPTQGG